MWPHDDFVPSSANLTAAPVNEPLNDGRHAALQQRTRPWSAGNQPRYDRQPAQAT